MKRTTILLITLAAATGAVTSADGAAGRHATVPRTPITCLTKSHLTGVKKRGANLWGGHSPRNDEVVLVDGPYPSISAARSAVKSLNGIEVAERGGRYEVTAKLRSGLNTTVDAVAVCLDGPPTGR